MKGIRYVIQIFYSKDPPKPKYCEEICVDDRIIKKCLGSEMYIPLLLQMKSKGCEKVP